MKSTRHSMLELLILAVRWCSLPLPLSAVEGYAASAYYYGTAKPFITIYWYGNQYSNWYSSKNSRTGYLQPLAAGGAATFTAIIGIMIGCLNRILDKVNNSYNPDDCGVTSHVSGNKIPRRSSTGSACRATENSFGSII